MVSVPVSQEEGHSPLESPKAAPEPDCLAPLPFSDLSEATHKNDSLGGTKQQWALGLTGFSETAME